MCEDLRVDGTCVHRDHHHHHDHDHDHGTAPLAAGEGRRMVVVGKGGVGKTTIAALLARQLARRKADVIAVDADEQSNLGATLGLDLDALASVVPLAANDDYVEEKTGARPGEGAGAMLRLSPDVTDVVDRMAVAAPDGVRLLVMGGVTRAGGGCLCPETALLASTIRSMRLRRGEMVVMDTHAGVEHFGRSLARGFDEAIVVVDPTRNAVGVGLDTARMAAELGISSMRLVVNRVRDPLDVQRARGHFAFFGADGELPFASVHALPYDEEALLSEPSVDRLLEGSALGAAVDRLAVDLLHPVAAAMAP
ncbi:MAG: ATP-binding protein [Acidimicrobiales bacterium]